MVAVSGIFRRHRKATTAVGTVVALIAMMAVGFSYWTGGGSGSGSATVRGSVSDVVVTQTASTGVLAPGESVALSGKLSNPNNTDIKVGKLTAVVGVVSGGVAADFSITKGDGIDINAVVKKGTDVLWSGMTLNYANSAVNQDATKGATVNIVYTLSPFTEPPAGPSAGTLTYINKALVIQHVGLWPHAGGVLTVQAGDMLVVPSCDWGGCHGDKAVTTAGADNEFNFTSAGGFYVLDPKNIELVRGATRYAHSPVMLIG